MKQQRVVAKLDNTENEPETEPEQQPSAPEQPQAPAAPATGDGANITALVMMMLVAAYGVLTAMKRRIR